MFDWTDEAVGELRRLHELGYAMSRISAEMRGTFGGPGRNAVIGKLYRLGLSWRKPPKTPRPVRPPRPPRPPVPRIGIWKPRMPARQLYAAPKPAPAGCTLWDLTNETCRWPLGDGIPVFYCGAATADLAMGRPYCPAHARVAYHPGSARRAAA